MVIYNMIKHGNLLFKHGNFGTYIQGVRGYQRIWISMELMGKR